MPQPSICKVIGVFVFKLFASCVLLSIASFWSLFVVVSMLFTGCKKGFGNLLHYKDRKKEAPPIHYIAWDEETRLSPGPSTKKWSHSFVTVPETGVRFHFVHTGRVPDDITISDIDGETVKLARGEGEEDVSNSKPKLMLCLHGFPENWFSWRHILRHFEFRQDGEEDYFVVAIDMRGYGDSDVPRGKMAYHTNALVGDVKGIVHALGYDTCILLAHDWGGAVAWMVAHVYPQLLERLVVLNCPNPLTMDKVMIRNPKQLFLNSWYMFFYQMPFLPEFVLKLNDFKFLSAAFNGSRMGVQARENRLTDDELEVFKYSLRNSTSGPINYYRAFIWPFCQSGPPLVYPKIETESPPMHTVPILLLWGDKDAAMIKQLGEGCRSSINPANGSKIVFVERASHWVQQDQPKIVIRYIEDFLK